MRVVAIPCLSDNYAYLVICETSNQAAVVDPSQAEPVLAAIEAEAVTPVAIWNTHHHWDHTGGNKGLLERWPSLEVVGHESDKGRVPGQTRFVADGDRVAVGESEAEIIFNPGHTRGAISYWLAEPGCVFTGDTLFGGGCGRLFEGTPAEMLASLTRLSKLPDDTAVYCGHEYTVSNLRFAAEVEPMNAAITKRREQVDARRAEGNPTVPFSIADDRATNPFLRAHISDVANAARANEDAAATKPAEVFGAIRRWKDRF